MTVWRRADARVLALGAVRRGRQDGTDVDAGFSLLTAHDLLSKDVDELKALVRQRREAEASKRDKERRPRERERPADGRVKQERRGAEDKAGGAGAPRTQQPARAPACLSAALAAMRAHAAPRQP